MGPRLADRVGGAPQASWVEREATRRHPGDDTAIAAEVEAMASAVEAGQPLQYVLGSWSFRGLELKVDRRALIPRPETEQVVELALAILDAGPAGPVLDLGTGSGAIALAIAAERPNRRVVATDASGAALELAGENAAALGLTVELQQGSWFDAVPSDLNACFALLISNPPYVPDEAYGTLEPQLRHEPRMALTAGAGTSGVPGCADLELICRAASAWLTPGGALVLEHGEEQGDRLAELLGELGFREVRVEHDLAGHVRATTARWRP